MTSTALPPYMCMLLDIPDTHEDCALAKNGSKIACVTCPVAGRFFNGARLEDIGSTGHVLLYFLVTITVALSAFGLFGNVFIMYILHRQKSPSSFDTLLVALAGIDITACVFTVVSRSATLIYFDNLNRSEGTLYTILLMGYAAAFTKTASCFLTAVITFERYLAIAFPLKVKDIMTPKSSRFAVGGVLGLSCLLSLPRSLSVYVTKNPWVGGSIKSVQNLESLIMATSMREFWYGTMKEFPNFMDYFLPFPLLLVLHALVYYHVSKFKTRRRQLLNTPARRDITAAEMFTPVVIVLFLSNLLHLPLYAFMVGGRVFYRELYFLTGVAIVLNSAVNLPIYYYRGSWFRNTADEVLIAAFPRLKDSLEGRRGNEAEVTDRDSNQESQSAL